VIGAGQQAAVGDAVTLPTGYTDAQMLSICTPAGFVEAGHHFQGVFQCTMLALTPVLQYLDDSLNSWPGICNYMVCAWK
jgi:hypothetical protein